MMVQVADHDLFTQEGRDISSEMSSPSFPLRLGSEGVPSAIKIDFSFLCSCPKRTKSFLDLCCFGI